jgi:amino acid transporter
MEMQTQLEKVRKVSKVVKTICKVLIGLTIIFYIFMAVLIVLSPNWMMSLNQPHANANITWTPTMTKLDIGTNTIPLNQPEMGHTVLLYIFISLVFAVSFKAQFHLYKLFENYSKGNIFTAESVAQIKQLGVTLFLVAGIEILSPLAAAVLGASKAVFSVPFQALIMGGLVILIAWVMDAARGLREENEATI